MASDLYQKGINKIQELTASPDSNPTGFMNIGADFQDIAPDLTKYVVEFAFGEIYSRPGLDNKQKVLTTITALVAQGKPQIAMHIKTGLAVGLTPEEIVGCIMHLIPYTGFPSVLNALTVTKEVFKEQGVTVDTSALSS
ncbi:carboxymuconolactone decarboxylase family protein [Thiopseudomonas acetoxidans]|uniref:Carboxymuconolactone decarboxylase family protein n=1 Tax=Thiopseudomonas acetoxidans TaxID=3041622 RepID=A0ABT7SRK8_9GAMM|nr:carboxymuconolactone decarboxylase family protein [Thiopseudomonas sp. CY1220]MDM7858164.1 carboxymuconolactone decarboxylase family protein [Thiopseudomonas sp. CY1220]